MRVRPVSSDIRVGRDGFTPTGAPEPALALNCRGERARTGPVGPFRSALSLEVGALAVVLRRRRLSLLALTGAGCVGACVMWVTSSSIRRGLDAAAAADPRLELVAFAGFVLSLAATACCWRAAFAALGAPLGRLDACARYGAGSIVNTFLPSALGNGVRGALFGRALPRQKGRVASTAGAIAAIAVLRALVHAVLLGAASLAGVFPLWPLLSAGGVAAAGTAALLVVDRFRPGGRLRELAAAAHVLLRSPPVGSRLLGWTLLAVAARLVAAIGVVSALGLPSPLPCALLITAALDVASAIPATPGGLGIASGAITLALAARGVAVAPAIAAALLFHAAETLASLAFAAGTAPLALRPRVLRHVAARFAFGLVGLGVLCVSAAALLDLA